MAKLWLIFSLLILSVSCIAEASSISLQQRVDAQRAIEEVYWKHTIWPADNPQPKPGLEAALSQQDIQTKVEEYLRKSSALEILWHAPITADQMQAEIDRMARETKEPAVLRELWASLHNDPYLIAECLARPILADRISQQTTGFNQWWIQYGHQAHTLLNAPARSYHLPEIKAGTSFEPFEEQPSVSNSWTATTTTGAPSKRFLHSAVWTGAVMIIWGGVPGSGCCTSPLNTGGRYNPATNSWSPTSTAGAPAARYAHTAVWTGSTMIIWGGAFGSNALNNGGRYNPSTNSWVGVSNTGAPAVRYYHTAVWTGTQMIVWGGYASGTDLKTGGKYTLSTDSWSPITTTGAPSARESHTAIWTGSLMIIFGGQTGYTTYFRTGGRYNPSTNSWTATSTTNAPSARALHTAVWTGSQMIVWGGENSVPTYFNTGGRYNPSTNSWTTTSTAGAPSARVSQSAVWTGTKMIIWGGFNAGLFNTGGRYTPSTNSWSATTTTGAPSPRYFATAVWTGTKMIVWGGDTAGSGQLNTGGQYTP